MNPSITSKSRPLWVRLALWGVPNRALAWALLWTSVALAVGCVVYGFVDHIFFLGSLFLLSAFWYYAAIRWVDRFDRWS